MSRGILHTLLGVCSVLLLADYAQAQSTVGGVINSDTTWTAAGSPYRVTDTIIVTGDARLTIEAGVRVEFDGGQGLYVGPEVSPGTGELIVNGGTGTAYTAFIGGTGLEFGPKAVPAILDPQTGTYISGSRLLRCRVLSVSPGADVFSVRIGSALPHLDEVLVGFAAASAGIRVDLTGHPGSSVRWGVLRFDEIRGTALDIQGGSGHRISALHAVDLIRRGADDVVLRTNVAQSSASGAYDVWVGGGLIRDLTYDAIIPFPEATSLANRRYRLDGMTFQRCSGTVLTTRRFTNLELNGCSFEDCLAPYVGDRFASSLLARGTAFISGGSVIGGQLFFEDCRFEDNSAPAVSTQQFASATRCTFAGNTGSGVGGAIAATFVDAFDSRFERNTARLGGAIHTLSLASAGNTFIANTADKGGAIYLDRARRSLIGQPGRPDVFTGNAATQDGGAIFVDGDLIELVAIELQRNTASRGGGIFVSPGGRRLLISREGGTGTFIGENLADIGDAIYVEADASTGDILAPCIDWGTSDPTTIADRIHDGADDPLLATINFDPIGPCDCRPDIDGDGALTIFDFLAFQTAFDAGDLETADFDGDGQLTLFDFLEFQTAFDAGCA